MAMDYEAGDYQKLAIKQFAPRSIRETAEGKYWKQFKAPVVAKQVRFVHGQVSANQCKTAHATLATRRRPSLCTGMRHAAACVQWRG